MVSVGADQGRNRFLLELKLSQSATPDKFIGVVYWMQLTTSEIDNKSPAKFYCEYFLSNKT